jgi:predicted negative regulator of RcsB-dependent stress response
VAEYETEEEQVKALKEWWNENGRSVIAGIVIGVAGLGGFKYWTNHQEQQALIASDLYSNIRNAIIAQDEATIIATATELKESYSNTPYAAHGALLLAKAKADKADNAAAIENLQWVIDNTKEDSIKVIAQLRLARMYIEDNALDNAEKLLDQDYPLAYQSLLMEVRGDLFVSRGDMSAARDAYQRAIETADENSINFLKMKSDHLGGDEQS